jgi:hypothetical protein
MELFFMSARYYFLTTVFLTSTSFSTLADTLQINGPWCHYKDIDNSGTYPNRQDYIFMDDGSYTFNGNGTGTDRYLYRFSGDIFEVKFAGTWTSQKITLEGDDMVWESIKYPGFEMHFNRGNCR